MKLHVLRGRKGEVLATFYRTPDALASVEPDVEDGYSVEEVEAPEDYSRDLAGFYRKLEQNRKK